MEMEEQYVTTDLSHYAMVMLGSSGDGAMLFGSDIAKGMGSATSSLSADCGGDGNGLDMEIGGCGGRWPRKETLTLLEVRSRLDSKFKEAKQKGLLWDEVSRIMSVEHGFQRTGKKCSEKFENLYKYYKKTKEGKAGRQDGKHYRFFHQLEALYCETRTSTNPNSNPPSPSNLHIGTCTFQAHPLPTNSYQETFQPVPQRLYDSFNLSNNTSVFDTSLSDYGNQNATLPPLREDSDCVERMINNRRLGKTCWNTKITDFIETKMRKIMEKQEAWMEKMMKTIDEKEKERVLKEEQWRKEEVARFEMEHKFRANVRGWMESQDSALIAALHKLTAKESTQNASSMEYCNDQKQNDHNNEKIVNSHVTGWGENEITQLIHLRTSMETRFEQRGCMEDALWEEIALKMACLGYHRNALICKAMWDDANFLSRTKKRNQKMRCSNLCSHYIFQQANERAVSLNDQQNDGCYRVLTGDPEMMWNYYGAKIAKGENH